MPNKKKTKIFNCDVCDYGSNRKYHVDRHKRLKHVAFKFNCSYCQFRTKRRYLLDKHLKRHTKDVAKSRKENSQFSCYICKIQLSSRAQFDQHLDEFHEFENGFSLLNSAFGGQVREYSRNLRLDAADSSALKSISPEFIGLCQELLVKDFAVFSLNIIM